MTLMKPPVTIAVTGAAGQISYSLLFRLLAGDLLGTGQPFNLSLLETPEALKFLDGLLMELQDCASPLLGKVSFTSNPEAAFDQADIAFLIGASPRTPGMERKDLLHSNAGIFSEQGKALGHSAKRSVKVLVVGNPTNTNALIASANAKGLDPANFSAMSRLDHNRIIGFLAARTGTSPEAIARVIIWGNHSVRQYPDIRFATIAGKPALDVVGRDWYEETMLPALQNRGGEVLKARGKSSAGSAANAAIEAMGTWINGTAPGNWTSMIVASDGSYGVPPGLMYSFPVEVKNGSWSIVQGLEMDAFSRQHMDVSTSELLEEKAMVSHLMVP